MYRTGRVKLSLIDDKIHGNLSFRCLEEMMEKEKLLNSVKKCRLFSRTLVLVLRIVPDHKLSNVTSHGQTTVNYYPQIIGACSFPS